MENEIGRLFQVIRYIKGTYTCFLIQKHKVTQYIKVTYTYIVWIIIPQRKETHRVRIAVGGENISYDDPVSITTSDLTTAKIHWNSVLSTPDGKYLIVDVKNLYLNNPIKKAEYYKIFLKIIPQEIIDKYELIKN